MTASTQVFRQQLNGGNELVVLSIPVTGGVLYNSLIENGGVASDVSQVFVPNTVPSPTRFLPLTSAKSDAGVALTATSTAGAMGVLRTAGTSLQLTGEATSASAVTDKAIFEFDLPDSYIAGQDIPITVNAVVTGSGTLTTASTTMTVAAYSETNGAEAALTVSAAVMIPKTTAADLSFTLTGTNLVPRQRIVLELVMLVTTSAGACTGFVNRVSVQA